MRKDWEERGAEEMDEGGEDNEWETDRERKKTQENTRRRESVTLTLLCLKAVQTHSHCASRYAQTDSQHTHTHTHRCKHIALLWHASLPTLLTPSAMRTGQTPPQSLCLLAVLGAFWIYWTARTRPAAPAGPAWPSKPLGCRQHRCGNEKHFSSVSFPVPLLGLIH